MEIMLKNKYLLYIKNALKIQFVGELDYGIITKSIPKIMITDKKSCKVTIIDYRYKII